MKQVIVISLILCILFAGVLTVRESGFEIAAAPQETEETSVETGTVSSEPVEVEQEAPAETESAAESIDYAAIYALHKPTDVIAKVGDQEVTWGQYFYSFYSYATQIEQMLEYYKYYGMELSWDDVYDAETGMTYREVPAMAAATDAQTLCGLNQYAQENKYEFDEECQKQYEETLQSNMQTAGAASEEEFFSQLESVFVTRDVYDNQVKTNIMSDKIYADLFGEAGSKITDAEAKKYVEDNGYYHCMHILLTNFDSETGEPLPDEETAEKKATAEDLLAQLNAEKNVEKRKELFLKLADQYNEDSGSEYTFQEGEAVTEFETTAKNLADNEVGIAESTYGYHVIMKLPVNGDTMLTSSEMTAREAAATESFNEKLSAYIDNLPLVYEEGFEIPQP